MKIFPIFASASFLALASCSGAGQSDSATRAANTEEVDNQFTRANGGAFPSCYEGVSLGVEAPTPQRHLFVVVDRTKHSIPRWPARLRQR